MRKSLLIILTLFTITLQSQTKIESAIDEYYDGSSWVNSEGYNYEYDNNGNVITETSYSWIGSGWTESYKESFTYNVNNKVTELNEMLETVQIHGLSLKGGEEEKVGYKSFDELDEVLDALEIE